LPEKERYIILHLWETIELGGFAPPVFYGGFHSPPDERKEGDTMYVTYQDLFLFCTFIVALISPLCQIFKGKK